MRSRYDLYKKSSVLAASDSSAYPDVCSVNFTKFKFTDNPTTYTLTAVDIKKFSIFIGKMYKMTELDDIILNINNIESVNDLKPGDKIVLPSLKDLETYYYNNRK